MDKTLKHIFNLGVIFFCNIILCFMLYAFLR